VSTGRPQRRAESEGLTPSDAPSARVAPRRHRAPLTLTERIERALVLAAYIVVRHGPVYAPLLERLEKELEAARRNDPTERAKRILKAYSYGHRHQGRTASKTRLKRKRLPERRSVKGVASTRGPRTG
jgi:hypothetical protein